jgi:hypothetical protein
MYHTIVFAVGLRVDLEVSPRQPLECRRLRRGTRLRAQIKPYVVEAAGGPLEVADLFFEDGTATRAVRFACFSFLD